MATFKKLPSGKTQAQVFVGGVRKSKSFRLKSDAKAWASDVEYSLRQGEAVDSGRILADVFDKYAREHSPRKRGRGGRLSALKSLSATLSRR